MKAIVDVEGLRAATHDLIQEGPLALYFRKEFDRAIDAHAVEIPDLVERDKALKALDHNIWNENRDPRTVIECIPAWTGKEADHAWPACAEDDTVPSIHVFKSGSVYVYRKRMPRQGLR